MTYAEVQQLSKGNVGPYCKSCPVCNGRGCGSHIPGPGSKGSGTVAARNYQKWQEILLNMDTVGESGTPDTGCTLFGKELRIPVFAAPIGALKLHYGEKYDDRQYNDLMVSACKEAGIAAFVGDALDGTVLENSVEVIRQNAGCGVPTVKPWHMELVQEKMELSKSCDPFAIAMDIDAAGLPFLKDRQPPAGSKSVEQLRKIAAWAERPFILKGVMTVAGALKAAEAGVSAIVVSNHGGRVLDCCPSTAEVLPQIADAVKGKMTILVDGGIRSGMDIFKALALGADGVLIGRPFVNMLYGAEKEGVQVYVKKLQDELQDTMLMCGAKTLADISRSMLFGY